MTFRQFITDRGPDLAAALTYFAVLALAPAILAFVSLLGLIGNPQQTVTNVLTFFEGLLPPDSLTIIEGLVEDLANAPGAGFAFISGLLVALWSASNYVNAFSRSMNRIYEIQEGRPFWKLRPLTIAVTVAIVVLAVIAVFILVMSGPIADHVGSLIGLGPTAVMVWNIAKWPVLLLIAVLMISLLFYSTPNIQQPKFRWVSLGALAALIVWAIASAAFGIYVANFGNYDATYGSLGGVVIFLLWLWISNMALLFGAELDAELERARELQAGIRAEERIKLPPRATRKSDKAVEKHADDVRKGRDLRKESGRNVEG